MAKQYQFSPFGIAVHPWIGKADTKFATDKQYGGSYKVDLSLSGQEALDFKAKVDAEAEAAFERFWDTEAGKKVPPKDRKAWSVFRPYTEETDDAGNPTGYILFKFRQNAYIKLKDGTVKAITIGIKDAKNNAVHKPVFGGSELRTMFTFRDIPVPIQKQAGVRLDFAQVQVIKLANSSGPSFGEVDGYVEGEGDGEAAPASSSQHSADTGGDY